MSYAIEEIANAAQVKVPWWKLLARNFLQVLRSDSVLALIFPTCLLIAWFSSISYQWLPEQILPSPGQVASTFSEVIHSGELLMHTLISLQRVIWGFLLGALLGVALGVLMGLSRLAEDYIFPTFKLFAQVPSLAWLPLLMMLVGLEEALKIILIAKSAFVPIALNTFNGLRAVPNKYIEVARVYEFSRVQLLTRVVIPAAFPPMWNGIRYGLTHAWLALVGVELLASTEGLGYLIVWGRQLFQLDLVFVAIVVVGSIGYVLDKGLNAIEIRVLHWRRQGF